MEQYALYILLKNIIKEINSNYSISFNDMDFNKENSIGIYIKGGEVSNYRDLSDGRYYNYIARVQFMLQGGKTLDSLERVLYTGSNLRDRLITMSNTSHNILADNKIIHDNLKLSLGLVKLLGDVNFDSKTSQGLPKYSINFKINYYIKEV